MIDMRKRVHRWDWCTYLVAADMADDEGKDALAAVLRKQGELMRCVVETIRQFCADKPGVKNRQGKIGGLLPDGGQFTARVGRRQITLRLNAHSGLHAVEYRLVRSIIQRPDYLPERIRREVFPLMLNNGA